MQTTVKMLDAGAGRIGGYLVVWGSPGARDLHGEYFTPQTDLALAWYSRRPVLYQHGRDGHLKTAVIGVLDTLRPDDVGLWAEAQLDLRQRYVRAVRALVARGALGWSSGSLPHLVEVEQDGRIVRWPVIEGSLTPTPAEPRRSDAQTIKSAYAQLGLDMARFGFESDKQAKGATQMHDDSTAPERPARKRLPLASAAEATKDIRVSSEYDTLDAFDLLHGYMLMRAGRGFRGVSERYANALAHKVRQAGLTAAKSDELSYSTQASFGDEWVPDLWSAQIWQRARLENTILPLFQAVEMPSNPFELPIEGADPVVYYVPETASEAQLTLDAAASAIPDSKIGSGKVTLTAKKLALRVGFSAELVEDAVVPVLNLYRQQAMRAILDSIDQVLLNGDTTTSATGNINLDDAQPPATARYLAFDGLRKLPLVTTTANRVDASGAVDLAKLRAARFKMPGRYSTRPSDLGWIVDGGTYAKLLGLEQFLTMDKAGPHATALSGQIGFMDGAPVVVSAEMPLTEADGKVSATGGSNTKGTALCVYRPGWIVGYRRRIAVNVDHLPYYDSYQLTATVRLAFVSYDAAAASALYHNTV